MPAAPPRPAVLCIFDGWGFRTDPRDNAILDARTPNFDRLVATCPQALIDASESFVGLPKGQMGNSEVGHMNLGAGRVAVPDLPRIDNAIEDGSLAKNPLLADMIATLGKSGGTCHLMGLASPGGVHAHQDHLIGDHLAALHVDDAPCADRAERSVGCVNGGEGAPGRGRGHDACQ